MRVRTAAVVLLVGLGMGCRQSGEETRTPRERPNACITEEATRVTHQPDFKAVYTYCAKGSRALGGPATVACLERNAGLTEECAGCYSWYKACVLKHCFNACFTTRPEPHCLLCRRNFCEGSFMRCGGTKVVFPGSPRR